MKIRQVITYKDYFRDFMLEQELKIRVKIAKVIELVEQLGAYSCQESQVYRRNDQAL